MFHFREFDRAEALDTITVLQPADGLPVAAITGAGVAPTKFLSAGKLMAIGLCAAIAWLPVVAVAQLL
jgi:hypothetical protein